MARIFSPLALCAALVLLIDAGSAIARCDPDETKIGEDRLYDYCMKTKVLSECQRKGGNVDRCINAGCVKNAGENLGARIATCRQASELCLAEKGASTALIAAITTCIAGAAADNLTACFGGTVIGGLGWDSAHYVCKIKFGDCVEPSLKEHKNFVTFCRQYGARP
jgi:hypothetical protein